MSSSVTEPRVTSVLCIVSEEKVWSIRLDIQIMNQAGNLVDAASIAGLAALCHARRADVTSITRPYHQEPDLEYENIMTRFYISEILCLLKYPLSLSLSMFPLQPQ